MKMYDILPMCLYTASCCLMLVVASIKLSTKANNTFEKFLVVLIGGPFVWVVFVFKVVIELYKAIKRYKKG